jgi:hypothetical protein
MDESQEAQLMATSSNSVIQSVTANAATVDLPPTDPNLSSVHSLEDTSDNVEELEAEMMRLRAENERVEKLHKVAMLKAEIARSRMEIKAKQVATAELMSSAKQVVAPGVCFQTPQISGLSSTRASDFTQGPSPPFVNTMRSNWRVLLHAIGLFSTNFRRRGPANR